MKLFILLLIIAIFLQTSFVPINLVLILIISRAFVIEELANYYLAFFGGILLGILSVNNIGFWPLVLLIIVKILHLSKKLPLSKNIFTVAIMAFVLLSAVDFLQSFLFHQDFEIKKVFIENIIAIPVYYLMKIWEERFIVKSEVKLKIRNR